MKNNKKILLTFIVLLLITIIPIHATTVSISERHAPAGAVIEIPVNIEGGSGVAGAEIVFQYDQSFLEFQESALSAYTGGFIIEYKTSNNQVAVSIANASGLTGVNGILFYMSFRVKQSVQVGTSTEITIVQCNLYAEDGATVSAETEHGVFKVSEIVVFPNPFTPNSDGFNDVATFVFPDSISGNITVKLYNISGNKVTEISGTGNSTIEWNGLNDNGQKLRPGPYIYLLQSESKTLSKGTITIMH